ncbi:MAG: rhomboid family intramembrane serine protease [Gammaproteobacteria bacterium]
MRARGPLPQVTLALSVGWIWIHLWQSTLDATVAERAQHVLGLIPAVLTGRATLAAELAIVAPPWTLLTSQLVHADMLDLGSAVFYVCAFGGRVERALGALRFAVLLFVCGICAGLVQVVAAPALVVPILGASGAVSGVLGAHVLLAPRARLRFPPLFAGPLAGVVPALPAAVLLAAWFALAWVRGQLGVNAPGAFLALAAGFLCGMILVLFLKRRAVPLFAGC